MKINGKKLERMKRGTAMSRLIALTLLVIPASFAFEIKPAKPLAPAAPLEADAPPADWLQPMCVGVLARNFQFPIFAEAESVVFHCTHSPGNVYSVTSEQLPKGMKIGERPSKLYPSEVDYYIAGVPSVPLELEKYHFKVVSSIQQNGKPIVNEVIDARISVHLPYTKYVSDCAWEKSPRIYQKSEKPIDYHLGLCWLRNAGDLVLETLPPLPEGLHAVAIQADENRTLISIVGNAKEAINQKYLLKLTQGKDHYEPTFFQVDIADNLLLKEASRRLASDGKFRPVKTLDLAPTEILVQLHSVDARLFIDEREVNARSVLIAIEDTPHRVRVVQEDEVVFNRMTPTRKETTKDTQPYWNIVLTSNTDGTLAQPRLTRGTLPTAYISNESSGDRMQRGPAQIEAPEAHAEDGPIDGYDSNGPSLKELINLLDIKRLKRDVHALKDRRKHGSPPVTPQAKPLY